MIKTLTINYLMYNPACRYKAWHTKTFTQYTAENGNSVYVIGTTLYDKDEGNKIFKDLLQYEHKISRYTREATNAEILEYLDKSIDHFADYIDNYRQWKEAIEHNSRIRLIEDAFRKAALM